MEIFNYANCIPPISAKLLYGHQNNLSSISECERKWRELEDSEKLKYIEDSKRIKNSVLSELKPIQCWDEDQIKDISSSQLFYYFNYSTQQSLFPHLSETEIFEKCRNKLNKIKGENKSFSLIINTCTKKIKDFLI